MPKKKRILWVDDDAGYIQALVDELSATYEIEVVNSAEAFLDKIEKSTSAYYDGAIIDVMLPFGSKIAQEQADGGLRTGLAIIEYLKSSERFKSLPIVIFTIRSSADVDDFAEKYGVHIVRKQDTLDAFLNTVSGAFK